jgi:hypothetical protein
MEYKKGIKRPYPVGSGGIKNKDFKTNLCNREAAPLKDGKGTEGA